MTPRDDLEQEDPYAVAWRTITRLLVTLNPEPDARKDIDSLRVILDVCRELDRLCLLSSRIWEVS